MCFGHKVLVFASGPLPFVFYSKHTVIWQLAHVQRGSFVGTWVSVSIHPSSMYSSRPSVLRTTTYAVHKEILQADCPIPCCRVSAPAQSPPDAKGVGGGMSTHHVCLGAQQTCQVPRVQQQGKINCTDAYAC